ncbi:MAG: tetratricopeptide repeat protein [Calditrichaeota bacterium]|nr:MAG: tetratricopeptide repeat protein [Calditrichota bacterium]
MLHQPRKRLTKRQIKQDKFVTYYFKAQDYIVRNTRTILSGAAAIVVLLVAIFIYSSKQAEKEKEAVVQLTKARIEYFAGKYDAAIPLLNNVVESYGGTRSAKEGLFYLANAYFFTQKYDEARQAFEKFLDESDDDILNASAMAGIAACLEETGKYLEAAKAYEQAARKYSEGFQAPQNLLNAARCYVHVGEKESARQLLNEIVEDYADSNAKTDAEVLLAELVS